MKDAIIIIRLTQEEAKKVCGFFPNTKIYRSKGKKSKRKMYYMTAMHDQLRYLSGIDKTIATYNMGHRQHSVMVKGIDVPNIEAIHAYIELLEHEIMYFNGDIGGGRYGDMLTDREVEKYAGRIRYNQKILQRLKEEYTNK